MEKYQSSFSRGSCVEIQKLYAGSRTNSQKLMGLKETVFVLQSLGKSKNKPGEKDLFKYSLFSVLQLQQQHQFKNPPVES